MEPEGWLDVAGHIIPLLDPILSHMNLIQFFTSYLFLIQPILRSTNQLQ
jgi:hypothetical protein